MKLALRTFAFCLIIALTLLFISPLSAQETPPYLAHQGRLFDVDDKPLVGPQTLTFRVYDTTADTGTVLWTESIVVLLNNGYYSTVLGQTSAIPPTLFDGNTRYVGVTVGDETVTDELSPRLEITSVAYALKSSVAENAVGDLTPNSLSLGASTTLNSDGSVNIGDAMIATDGTITLGVATINTDGSIEVGNTTIGADGSITVNNAPVIAADGSIDSSSISGTTLADLETAGCSTGQLPQFDDTSGWGCFSPAAGTIYGAGSGLNIDASSVFSVDSTVVQTRIVNTCNAGEAIQAINEDGSVICEVDDDTQYTAGAGVEVLNGVISLIDATDDDTQYAAGTGLALNAATNTFNVDQTQIEAWAAGVDTNTTYSNGVGLDLNTGVFSVNQAQIEAWANGVDDDTTYNAGAGISISGTTISVTDTVDDDTTYSAGVGLALSGTTFSLVDASDNDTTYAAGNGLTLSGAANTFAVDASIIQARVTGTCGVGQYLQAINLDGTVLCGTDQDTDTLIGLGCGADEIAKLQGGTWTCVADNAHSHTATDVGAIAAGGSIPVGNNTNTCDASLDGSMRYDGANLEFCDGTDWLRVQLRGRNDGSDSSNPAIHCLDLKTRIPSTSNGVYWIDPDNDGNPSNAYEVYCDMTTDGGGWTMITNNDNSDTELTGCYAHIASDPSLTCGASISAGTDWSARADGLPFQEIVWAAYSGNFVVSSYQYMTWSGGQTIPQSTGDWFFNADNFNQTLPDWSALPTIMCTSSNNQLVSFGNLSTPRGGGVYSGNVVTLFTGTVDLASEQMSFTEYSAYAAGQSMAGLEDFQDGWGCGDAWSPTADRGKSSFIMIR